MRTIRIQDNEFHAKQVPTTESDGFGGIVERWDIRDKQTGLHVGKLVQWHNDEGYGFFTGLNDLIKIRLNTDEVTLGAYDDVLDTHKAWAFVEKYLPNYNAAHPLINRHDTLYRLIEAGTANADQINEYKTTLVNIYNAAIEGFYATAN